MARAHTGEIPGQLSLDDWTEIVEASAEPGKTRPDRAQAPAIPRHHQSARELLDTPGALLTRTHLRELGLERRAVDAVFRALPVVALPGYSRPLIRADQYCQLVEEFTYRDDRAPDCTCIMSARG
jgi:hypothetical protein